MHCPWQTRRHLGHNHSVGPADQRPDLDQLLFSRPLKDVRTRQVLLPLYCIVNSLHCKSSQRQEKGTNMQRTVVCVHTLGITGRSFHDGKSSQVHVR